MNWKKALFVLACGLSSANTYAFFCPSNFNQIDIGYSQQQIDELCGKPTFVTETEKQPEDNLPQEWTYFVKEAQMLGTQTPGSIKATIAFDQKGEAINISVNGLSVNTTNLCGKTILIGTKRDILKKACGTPAYINKAQNSSNTQPPTKQMEYRYDGTPPVVLIFENGVLVEKK